MPANFTEEQKLAIREKLIAIGYDLIRKVGLKKMKVAMIAEKADIATGKQLRQFGGICLCADDS